MGEFFNSSDKEEIVDYEKDIEEFVKALIKESGFKLDDVYSKSLAAEEFREDLHDLLKCVNNYTLLAIKGCNESLSGFDEKREKRIEGQIREIGVKWGVAFRLGGDPRGYVVKMLTPRSGCYNTWGGAEEGFGVASSETIRLGDFKAFEKWFWQLKYDLFP